MENPIITSNVFEKYGMVFQTSISTVCKVNGKRLINNVWNKNLDQLRA